MKVIVKRRGGPVVLTLLFKDPEEAQKAFSGMLNVVQTNYIIGLFP